MKFSIIIPTQDRPHLLSLVVKYAMQLQHSNFDVIVSDNSTTDAQALLTEDAVRPYIGAPNFRLIRPSKALPLTDHFEFALKTVSTADYVVYLTDKMIVLPHALMEIERAIRQTDADIVNWGYATYFISDIENPSASGTLVKETALMQGTVEIYDPEKALKFKASGGTPRNKQQVHDYVLGKIVFGCYRMSLIQNVLNTSGTLFGGATHDYSAMIQALALAKNCVMLNSSCFIFCSLPSNKSLGSLTETDSQAALRYFRSFSNADEILANLLVPGVYASQHNMVAHDYKKFLPLYGKERYFNAANWLLAIYSDLLSESKIWGSDEERLNQINLFLVFLEASRYKRVVKKRWELANRHPLKKWFSRIVNALQARVPSSLKAFFNNTTEPLYNSLAAISLQDAICNLEESASVIAMKQRDARSQIAR
jgi:glycosyltransferase involved in cell wall biosynthesis